jgi:hypothetical protein
LAFSTISSKSSSIHSSNRIWFLARGASRITDEQETHAVWGDLLRFGDLTTLPGYSKENHRQAIEFWQSWQNRKTGRLYNPLYQDPQNPEVERDTPGNRGDYSAGAINVKYIPAILDILGAKLPGPVNTATHADAGVDTFDQLWRWIPQWATSPAGAFPVAAARQVDGGKPPAAAPEEEPVEEVAPEPVEEAPAEEEISSTEEEIPPTE